MNWSLRQNTFSFQSKFHHLHTHVFHLALTACSLDLRLYSAVFHIYFLSFSLGQGDVGGDGGGGYYYSNNIPPTSYSLLLGACRLGIEPLAIATLELASMAKINSKQVCL